MTQVIQITSSANPQFKIWKSLITAQGIKAHQQFFLMGEKLVKEFLVQSAEFHSQGFKAEYIIHYEDIDLYPKIKKTLLSRELFKELDVLGTKSPLLILSFKDFTEKNFSTPTLGLELVCPLGDPKNLGSLVRTGLGLGINEVILTKESAHPFLPQAIKASAAAALKVKFTRTNLPISEVPMSGENYALALFGESLPKTSWPKNVRLWVGEEGPGLNLSHSQKKLMKFVNIPTTNIESLNATVSSSLAIWEWKKQNS